jgi:exfoliative toxin A/B
MGVAKLGQVIFYAGIVLYVAALVPVLIRLFKDKPLPEPARPTFAIFTAPVSLCLAGYMSSFAEKNAAIVYTLLAIAAINYIYVTVKMVWLLRLKFYPTYAAFTFPYVISAIAFKMVNAFLTAKNVTFFKYIFEVSKWVAVAVVLYVLVRYIIFFVSKPKAVPHAPEPQPKPQSVQ